MEDLGIDNRGIFLLGLDESWTEQLLPSFQGGPDPILLLGKKSLSASSLCLQQSPLRLGALRCTVCKAGRNRRTQPGGVIPDIVNGRRCAREELAGLARIGATPRGDQKIKSHDLQQEGRLYGLSLMIVPFLDHLHERLPL